MKKLTKLTIFALAFVLVCMFSACSAQPTQNNDDFLSQNMIASVGNAAKQVRSSGLLKLDVDTSPLDSPLSLPTDSSQMSVDLAMQSLVLCCGYNRETTRQYFDKVGLTMELQANFDKDFSSAEHTVAYSVGTLADNGMGRSVIVVAVRGTDGGEWYSNFDFAPSGNFDEGFCENFLFAAQDVFAGAKQVIGRLDNPLILVCGHSRGGAVANLLAVLLSAVYGNENVYGYTFATPNTVQGERMANNVFNFVNNGDAVAKLPLSNWGYGRAGTDISLTSKDSLAPGIANEFAEAFLSAAPTVSDYYNSRYSLTSSGTSDMGLTPFELMLIVSRAMITDGLTDMDVSAFDSVSSDSAYAQVIALFNKISANKLLALTAVRQHLPSYYQTLLNERLA